MTNKPPASGDAGTRSRASLVAQWEQEQGDHKECPVCGTNCRDLFLEPSPAAARAQVVEARLLRKLVAAKEPNGYPLWFNRAVHKCRRCDSEDLCIDHERLATADFKDCEPYVEAFIRALAKWQGGK